MHRETSRNFFFLLSFFVLQWLSHISTVLFFFLIQTNAIINLRSIINPQVLSTLAHLGYCSQFEFRVQFRTAENVHDHQRPSSHIKCSLYISMVVVMMMMMMMIQQQVGTPWDKSLKLTHCFAWCLFDVWTPALFKQSHFQLFDDTAVSFCLSLHRCVTEADKFGATIDEWKCYGTKWMARNCRAHLTPLCLPK